MKLPAALRALQHYNFRLFFSGQAISLIGTWMQRMAVSWLIYKLTHSALMLGITGFAGQIPVLLLSPYAGAFCDRHNRFRILLITQIASMIQAGLLALMVLMGYNNIPGIIFLSVILGVINAFDTPSRQSLMILLVESRKDLSNAIALNSSMVTLARLLGPAVAGILLAKYSEGVCFLLNFLSFIAVIGSLLLMKLKHQPPIRNEENIWEGLSKGYGYLKQHRSIRAVIILMALTSFFVMPYSTLLPVYAKEVFNGDVRTFSWLNSVSGLGALIGAIYMANLRHGRNLLKVIIFASGLFSLCLLFFSFTHQLVLALIFIMAGESGMLSQIAATNTYIQTNVDERMRGRVISYYVMAFQGMQPIGSFLIGFMAHQISAPHTVLVEGIIGIIIVLLFIPYLKQQRAKEKKAILSPVQIAENVQKDPEVL